MIDNSLPKVDVITNAFRDSESGAVIIDDPDGYRAAKKRKSFQERQLQNERDIQFLKERMTKMDANLDKLVNLLT